MKVIDINDYHNYNIIIDGMAFEWSKEKERGNVAKHGISFRSAASVFLDWYGILVDDVEHSGNEERYLLLGMSMYDGLLIISHCYRNDIVRIISARKAESQEREVYRWYRR
jgi:uncharacterized DUF497 family protein